MSENAINLLSDPETLSKFKKNANIQAKKFDVHNVVPFYENVYKKVLK